MSDEHALIRATSKATNAQQLLDNELLKEAFKNLEDSYIAGWRATNIEDVNAREKLFLAINIVGKVRDHLIKAVSDGKVAQAELNEIAKTAERKKKFGII